MNNSLKVKFIIPTADRESEVLYWFCKPRPTGWDWSGRIYAAHPELKALVSGVKSEKKFKVILSDYVRKYKTANKKEIKLAAERFQSDWDKIASRYFKAILSDFEMTLLVRRKIIKASVSINPICPRFLDDWSFHVRYDRPERMREIAMHEILHFLYFKKWLEVFPDTGREEMESPHLVWKLSEILATVILNNHPTLLALSKFKSKGYKEFQEIQIGKQKLIPYFAKIYKKHLKNKTPIGSFFVECWENAVLHRDVIEKI